MSGGGKRRQRRRLAGSLAFAFVVGAGFSLPAERQWHALPVAGGAESVSAAAGLGPGLPAWRVLYEATRRVHGLWGEEGGRAAPVAADGGPRGGSPVVALPLAPGLWRGLLGRHDFADDRLALAILADRRSSLLYRGLAGLDEGTLAALAAEPDVVRRIHRQHADVLAAFGARFRVEQGRVAVPGGEEAAPLWEQLVGESPGQPARFLEALLAANGGRRALFYDSVARLDRERQRFALGMRHPPGERRESAFQALAAVFDRERAWWRREGGAFARSEGDAARVLREVRLAPDGTLAPPAALAFWEAVFDAKVVGRAEWPEAARRSPPVDAAWLAGRVAAGDTATRLLRLEQLVFAQRMFGDVPPSALPEVALAVRSLRDSRAVLLALERMGTRDPALCAAAASVARRAGSGGGEAASLHRTLQGALGVVDRARFARTVDVAGAERLVRSLLDVPMGGEGQARALAAWMEASLLPELARAVYGTQPPGDPETTVLRAMAGDRAEGRERLVPFDWEGLWYRADPGRGEFVRLERVRARQGNVPLAAALRACRAPAEMGRNHCAAALGPALTSVVYAAQLGDPDGPALAGEDPSLRHDFGAEPWALPEEVSGPGVTWHVRGSLLGLERPLARLSLHRLAGDALPDGPPVLDAVQRRWLALPVALANPREQTDDDRDALVGAIEAGRRRVSSLRAGAPDVEAVGEEAGLEPWRARALEWMLEHEPDARESFFSLGELVDLGSPAGRRWDPWGVPDEVGAGLRLRMPPPLPLDEASGRLPEPALAGCFEDLGLRVAVHLSERRLPACLAPSLVATLLPDLFSEARPLAPDDRLGLDAWVRGLARTRLDDAVASLAVGGPLQPAPGGAR